MLNNQNEPSAAKVLAAIVTGGVNMSSSMATVQRSHRFPMHIFAYMENMAKMAGVPVSVIINQVIDAGMEAVMTELPEDVKQQILFVSQEQVDRPTKSVNVKLKNKNNMDSNKS